MTRTRWFDVAAIVLAIAIFVGIASVSCSGGVATPVATRSDLPIERPRTAADARPSVLFIGDSYTAGKGSETSYGCRAAVQMGWLCALSALGGTGYINGGPASRWVDPDIGKSTSFSERIAHLAVKYDPAVVVLDGGRNDQDFPRQAAFDAMISTIAEVRRTWPEAKTVFIRPRLLAKPGDDLGFDDDFMTRLESEPAARGVIFIDPISSLASSDTSGLLSSDEAHPNRQGDQRITAALVDSLVAHGVVLAS